VASPLLRVFFGFCLSHSFPGGKTRREEKPSVFIRFDVHAVKAGINLRGCGPLTTLSFLEAAPAAKRGGRFPVYLHNFYRKKSFTAENTQKKFACPLITDLKRKAELNIFDKSVAKA